MSRPFNKSVPSRWESVILRGLYLNGWTVINIEPVPGFGGTFSEKFLESIWIQIALHNVVEKRWALKRNRHYHITDLGIFVFDTRDKVT